MELIFKSRQSDIGGHMVLSHIRTYAKVENPRELIVQLKEWLAHQHVHLISVLFFSLIITGTQVVKLGL